MGLLDLPTFTFKWVKRWRGSIVEIEKDLITEGGECLRGQDSFWSWFRSKNGEEWGQPCCESFMVETKPFQKRRRRLSKAKRHSAWRDQDFIA